jgi:ribonuclease HII
MMSSFLPLTEIESKALEHQNARKALEWVRELLSEDTRSGAKNLIRKFEKKAAREEKECQKLETLWHYESQAMLKGFKAVAGVDEAGRGPLAGPVVAAAVILPPNGSLKGVDDSKKLTAIKRDELFLFIQQNVVCFGVGQASVQEIDEINIYRASQLAMQRAVEALGIKPDFLLTDAMPLPALSSIPQKPLIHGDALSSSIAAASILAKVSRDRMMEEMHAKYPQYGFDGHKGYGTEIHIAALKEHGACPEHRLTFGPVMEALAQKSSGGPFRFWSDKLKSAKNQAELNQAGLQVKRAALGMLSEDEVELLRELYRERRAAYAEALPEI